MADLTISSTRQVQVVQQFTGPAAEAIAVGNRCRFDATTGQITKGNATNAADVAAFVDCFFSTPPACRQPNPGGGPG